MNPGLPWHSSPIKLQTEYVLKNVDSICRAAGEARKKSFQVRLSYTKYPANEMFPEVLQGVVVKRLP